MIFCKLFLSIQYWPFQQNCNARGYRLSCLLWPQLPSQGKINNILLLFFVQFDNFVEETLTCTGERWCLVTDGQFPLRHHLHLEAGRKKAKLSQHFYSFYDLKKEVRKAVKHDSDFKDLEEVASCILSLAEGSHGLASEYLQAQHKIVILFRDGPWSFFFFWGGGLGNR